MRYPRSRRAAAIVGLSVLAFGAQASMSAGEEPGGQTYGMVEAVDPLVGFDWAPADADADAAPGAAYGARVTAAPSTFGERPGVLKPILPGAVPTTGPPAVTASGEAVLIF